MSSDLSDAQIAKQLFVSRCLIIIPYTILAHDYALTIGQEVERFWGTALTWGTSLFYINRYSALVGTIPVVIEYSLTTNDPRKLCDGFESYHQYFALLSQLLVSIMLITRTYALYERNKTILIITILVTVGAAGFGLAMILTVNDANTLSPHLQAFGCPSATTHSSNLRIAAAWGGMLVFDVMIFTLTVSKALKYSTRSGNLFTVLVRDGAMYFAVMITSNAVNIGTYTMGGPFLSGCATTVTNVYGPFRAKFDSAPKLTDLPQSFKRPDITFDAQPAGPHRPAASAKPQHEAYDGDHKFAQCERQQQLQEASSGSGHGYRTGFRVD